MSNIKQAIIVSCFFSLVLGTAFARDVKDGHIELGQGVAAPASVLKISLQKLVPGVAYTVNCSVNDPNNQNNKVVMVFSTDYVSGALGNYVLNDKVIGNGMGAAQVQLPMDKNTFIANSMMQFAGNLDFINADQDDSVNVSCGADPIAK